MEVDSTSTAPPAPDAEQLVNELGQLLEGLATEPNNVKLLRRQVDLMAQLGMVDEAVDAARSTSALSFLGEALWLQVLNAKIKAVTGPLNLDDFEAILEAFSTAEEEYISVAILSLHARFLLGLVGFAPEGEASGDASPQLAGDSEVVEFLDTETLRGMLKDLAGRSQCLVNQGDELWQLLIDWELKNLQSVAASERAQQLEEIHQIYLDRLRVPHATQDATASAYSSFCSEHCVEEYEQRMVQVTEVSQPAKVKWETEKRHGRTRADIEEQLAYHSSDIAQQAQLLLSYIDWETDPAAKKPKGRKGPRLDVFLTRGVFERTLLLYSNAAGAAEGETAEAYKAAEALVWERYMDWVGENVKPAEGEETEDGSAVVKVAHRATRACPGAGELWVRRLLILEAGKNVPEIDGTFDKAKSLIVDTAYPVSTLVDILYVQATILHRRCRDLDPEIDHPVFVHLIESEELVSRVHKNGDPSLRMEKFAVAWSEAQSGAEGLVPGVLGVYVKPVKARNASYEWTNLHARALAAHNCEDVAREVFTDAVQRSDLDWPEAVYHAFELFENVHGTYETIMATRRLIDHEKKKVARRREKQAAEEQAAAMAQYQAGVAEMAAAEAVAAPEAAEVAVVDGADEATVAAPAAVPEAKKEEPEQQVKRDRENTTVLVSGLKKGTEPSRLEEFFGAMGKIREVTMKPGDEFDSAMVEFKAADAVPAALNKDGKKIDGNTVSVSMLWRSTLWVTNFPPSMDDEALRTMFGNYGKILDTRWPSRKYANDRRFCYITMESPAAAQAALSLHKFKPDMESFPMTVLVSDPTARTKRTDAPDATLFVGGLHAKTTEGEVRHLLSSYGRITNVRLGWDRERKQCRGFAYVEMGTPDEAKAALAASGTQYRGKGLKVEISDPKHKKAAPGPGSATGKEAPARAAAERRSRTVYLYDLPPGTQEGLLQQEVEKIMPVKRLEVFQATQHAVVELESQNDAGLLKLRTEPLVFKGATLRIGDEADRSQEKAKATQGQHWRPATSSLAPQSSLGFVPSQRKRKAVGQAYTAPKRAVAVPVASGGAAGAGPSGQDAFRAMVNATNEARREVAKADGEGKAEGKEGEERAGKRAGEGGEEQAAKKAKTG